MKAVILAAGASSRFWPLASDHHKVFYKVGEGKTVLEYTVSGLLPQVEELIIVVGPRDEERVKSLFESESKVKVVVLPSPTGGGNAILAALPDDFSGKFFVTGGDKVFAGKLLEKFEKDGGVVGLRKTDTPEHYGIVSRDKEGYLTGLVEKPKRGEAPSEYKVTGAYLLDDTILPLLKKHTSEHYSLEISLDEYFRKNKVKGVEIDDMPDTSLHFPWNLIDLNHKLMTEGKVEFVHPRAKVSDSAVLKPPFYIGENAVIGDFTLVRDCAYIDANVRVGAHCEVKNSLVYEDSSLHRDYVGDSVIDKGAKLGAGVILANKRYDRGIVKSVVKGEKIETGLKALGSIIGKEANIGVNASIMPGVKIGNNAIVGPGKVQMEDVADGQTSK